MNIETQGTQKSWDSLEKKEKSWRTSTFDFKTDYKARAIGTVCDWRKDSSLPRATGLGWLATGMLSPCRYSRSTIASMTTFWWSPRVFVTPSRPRYPSEHPNAEPGHEPPFSPLGGWGGGMSSHFCYRRGTQGAIASTQVRSCPNAEIQKWQTSANIWNH